MARLEQHNFVVDEDRCASEGETGPSALVDADAGPQREIGRKPVRDAGQAGARSHGRAIGAFPAVDRAFDSLPSGS